MIANNVYECLNCKATINTRYQIGYIKKFVAHIPCPNCAAVAKIIYSIDNRNVSFEFNPIENAKLVSIHPLNANYHLEISSEFPTIIGDNITWMNNIGPFMRNVFLLYDPEKDIDITKKSILKCQYLIEKLEDYKKYFRYYKNKKDKFLEDALNENFGICNQDITNRMYEILSDYFFGFSNVQIKIKSVIEFFKIIENKIEDNMDFLNIIQEEKIKSAFSFYLKKITECLFDFISNFDMFYPLIITRYYANSITEEDFKKFYIVSVDVDEAYKLYKNCYEIICKAINIIILVNGLTKYSIEDIKIGKKNIVEIINGSYVSNSNKIKYAKIELELDDVIPNFQYLDNKLRNHEGHNDYEYDDVDKILFDSNGKIIASQFELAYKLFQLYDTLLFIFEYFLLLNGRYHLI